MPPTTEMDYHPLDKAQIYKLDGAPDPD